MAIFFLRHTRTAIPETVCYGSLDVDLAETFQDEWAAISIPKVHRIYSSPLTRCRRLADHLAPSQNLDVELDHRLIEMDFGQWQGINWSDLPRHEIDAWAEDFEQYKGHGGESVTDLRSRVQTFLKGLNASENTLIVSHSGVIRAALSLANNSDERQIKVAYGELIQLN